MSTRLEPRATRHRGRGHESPGLIPRHKRPRLVKFVDSLPKTAIGKIQKNQIRAPYWEGRERSI